MNLLKKSLVTVAVTAALSGCTTMHTVANYASGMSDEALKSSEFIICKGGSVGAITRRYNTLDLREAWRKLCLNKDASAPFIEGN